MIKNQEARLGEYLVKAEQESELRKLSRAVEQNPASIVITDLRGIIEYVNPKFIQLTGYSREEAIGKNPRILKSGLTPPETYKSMWHTITKGETWSGEYVNRKKNGELYWEAATVSPIMNENGEITHFVAIKEDITIRKKIENELQASKKDLSQAVEELKSSRQWLERIAETSPDILFILDLLLNKNVYANRSVTGLLGYTQEEFKNIDNITVKVIHPEDLKHVNEFYAEMKTASEGEIRELSHRVIHRNGSIHWMDVKVTPFSWNKEGCLSEVIGIARDVTEQVHQQEALIESEKRFRELADSMPQIVWTARPDGTVDYYNSRAFELDGISQVDSEKWVWAPVLHPEDTEITINAWNNAVLNGTTYEIAHRVKMKSGEFRWFLSRGFPIKNDRGNTVKWYGTATDIHVQKEIESKLSQALAQLALSEKKLNEAQKLANLGSFLLDLKTDLVEASDELYNILEIKKGTPLTLNSLIRNIYEEDFGRVSQLLKEALQNNTGIDTEFRYIAPGGMKHLKIVSRPLKENDAVIKLFGTAMDVTEQKIQEHKLEIILAELKRSNKDLEQFAYTASHDLQEPIRMIKSYAQLLELKHKNSLDNNAQEFLYFITEGASRMQQLVNDLLSYSRVTTTKQELELVDTNFILKSVLDDLKFRIAEENAIINIDNLPRVRGDKTQLRQLFQNFIQNAIKFKSDRNPEINIRCEKRRHDWLFSISDNGIGIDPQFYDRIFIIFQRLHDREKYSGTGVGLAICKKIVERHGGEVFVESKVNEGTTFSFTLPF